MKPLGEIPLRKHFLTPENERYRSMIRQFVLAHHAKEMVRFVRGPWDRLYWAREIMVSLKLYTRSALPLALLW